MRRFRIPFLLMLTFLSMPLSAQIFSTKSADWSLSVEPRIGMTYGALGEFLYMKLSDGTWKKNSYLEWEEKPLWTGGIQISGRYKNLRLQTTADAAIPLRSGSMMDSDWKLQAQPDVKTNYSIHENTTSAYIQALLSLAYDFSPLEWLVISPIAEGAYAYRCFEARNGEGWYGDTVPWDDPSARHYPGTYDGKRYILGAIDYRIHTVQIFTGLEFTFIVTPKLQTSFAISVSPYSYVFTEDRHYTDKARTAGRYYVYKGHFHFTRYKGCFSVRYRLNRFVTLGLTASGLVTDNEKLTYYDEDASSGKIYKNSDYQGGFTLAETSLILSAKIHIF